MGIFGFLKKNNSQPASSGGEAGPEAEGGGGSSFNSAGLSSQPKVETYTPPAVDTTKQVLDRAATGSPNSLTGEPRFGVEDKGKITSEPTGLGSPQQQPGGTGGINQ